MRQKAVEEMLVGAMPPEEYEGPEEMMNAPAAASGNAHYSREEGEEGEEKGRHGQSPSGEGPGSEDLRWVAQAEYDEEDEDDVEAREAEPGAQSPLAGEEIWGTVEELRDRMDLLQRQVSKRKTKTLIHALLAHLLLCLPSLILLQMGYSAGGSDVERWTDPTSGRNLAIDQGGVRLPNVMRQMDIDNEYERLRAEKTNDDLWDAARPLVSQVLEGLMEKMEVSL